MVLLLDYLEFMPDGNSFSIAGSSLEIDLKLVDLGYIKYNMIKWESSAITRAMYGSQLQYTGVG